MATSTRAADVMTAMADRAEEWMQHDLGLSTTGVLRLPCRIQGRVFRRLQSFAELPPTVKAHADVVAMYLCSPDILDRVFSKSAWQTHRLVHSSSSHQRVGVGVRHPIVGPVAKGSDLVDAAHTFMLKSRDSTTPTVAEAKQTVELLVLSGFISPVVEPTEPEDDNGESNWMQTHVHDSAFYELVAPGVLGANSATPTPLSVWAMADGATRADFVFHKKPPSTLRSLLSSVSSCFGEQSIRERRRYVVVNRDRQLAAVFEDDVARRPLASVDLSTATVQYAAPSSSLYHGLELWTEVGVHTDVHTERFDFVSRHDQNEWILAFVDGGANYKESHPRLKELVSKSFYDLQEVDGHGNVFSLRRVAEDKVVLLVNVASKDPEAALQYPELVALADKYRPLGLVILACPCDQFLNLEMPTEHEIVTHVQHAYGARFRVLAKRDVNGPLARQSFVYCNTHLPGQFGAFTPWNFTKFLIDKRGKPFRRYATSVLPSAMEADVRKLLGLGHNATQVGLTDLHI